MLPYILAAVGGYLIGDSLKGKQYADGGMMAKGGKTEKVFVCFVDGKPRGLLRGENTFLNTRPYWDYVRIMEVPNEKLNDLTINNCLNYLTLFEKQYAEGGMMARGGLTGRDKKLLDAGFRLTIITDMYNHKIIIEKNKKTNKIEYIVIEGDIFSKHKKLKEFDTESEAFSYLSTKAGRKVKQAVD